MDSVVWLGILVVFALLDRTDARNSTVSSNSTLSSNTSTQSFNQQHLSVEKVTPQITSSVTTKVIPSPSATSDNVTSDGVTHFSTPTITASPSGGVTISSVTTPTVTKTGVTSSLGNDFLTTTSLTTRAVITNAKQIDSINTKRHVSTPAVTQPAATRLPSTTETSSQTVPSSQAVTEVTQINVTTTTFTSSNGIVTSIRQPGLNATATALPVASTSVTQSNVSPLPSSTKASTVTVTSVTVTPSHVPMMNSTLTPSTHSQTTSGLPLHTATSTSQAVTSTDVGTDKTTSVIVTSSTSVVSPSTKGVPSNVTSVTVTPSTLVVSTTGHSSATVSPSTQTVTSNATSVTVTPSTPLVSTTALPSATVSPSTQTVTSNATSVTLTPSTSLVSTTALPSATVSPSTQTVTSNATSVTLTPSTSLVSTTALPSATVSPTTQGVMRNATSVTVTTSQVPVTSSVPRPTTPIHTLKIDIKVHVENGKITEGSDVTLTCKYTSNSNAQITWKRDNEKVTQNPQQINSTSELVLRNITRSKGGNYSCEVQIGSETRVASKVLLIDLSREPKYPPSKKLEITDSTIPIPIHYIPFLNNGKKVRYVQLVVAKTDKTGASLRDSDSYEQKDLMRAFNESLPNIAVFIDTDERWTRWIKLGDDEEYSSPEALRVRRYSHDRYHYRNHPLRAATYYTVFQRMFSTDGYHESLDWMHPPVKTKQLSTPTIVSHEGQDNIGLIMGIFVGLLFLTALLLVGLYVLKKRYHSQDIDEDKYEITAGKHRLEKIARTFSLAGMRAHYRPCGPIQIDVFDQHVARMRRSGDLFYSTEYERIPDPDNATAIHTLDPVNHWKNRYINIVAYDHSRVKLTPFDDEPGTDYINANYIDGYNEEKAYIAAQGPLEETCGDFWRMVWEQNARTIVMLTNLKERCRDKCAQYWPTCGTKTYEDINVTLDDVMELTPYTIRTFRVEMADNNEVRLVKQFHFTSWPDHGVPNSVTFLLAFVHVTARANTRDAGPMVVHCSAGVGRTGTFIVIDAMLKQIKEEKTVDILGFVTKMRKQRNLMVQTEQQYIFTHDALLDAIISGETETSVTELRGHVRSIQEEDEEKGLTPMFLEFQKLSHCINSALTITSATLSVNKHKNRYANVLPYDKTRVRLAMQVAVDGSDYINANYIDGYAQKKAFIATQAPIPVTIPDFWRMVWEQESRTIVTLAQEVEQAKPKMHRYWPSLQQPITFGSLVVELQEEQNKEHCVIRVFKLTSAEESASRVVKQFHYTAWTEEIISDTGCQMIDLIGQVQKWQSSTGNHVAIVHCSAGVGRTGVFCAVDILIERLKAEALVDVFLTVKQLREQRPAMVQTKGQYELCYQVLLEYLESFEPLEACNSSPDLQCLDEHGQSYPVLDEHVDILDPVPQISPKKSSRSSSHVYEETVIVKEHKGEDNDEGPRDNIKEFRIKHVSPPVSPVHHYVRSPSETDKHTGPGSVSECELSDYEHPGSENHTPYA